MSFQGQREERSSGRLSRWSLGAGQRYQVLQFRVYAALVDHLRQRWSDCNSSQRSDFGEGLAKPACEPAGLKYHRIG